LQDAQILALKTNVIFYPYGISVCDVDWRHGGYMMAHAVIGDIPIPRTTRGYIRLRARVVDKLTTRWSIVLVRN
jgi:hypothetical protein